MIFESIIRALVFTYGKLVYWFRVEGLENIPKEGPVILAPNHISNLDAPLIISVVNRKVFTMSKKELFKPGIKWFFNVMGCFPVDRSRKDMGALKKSIRLLKNNNVLCIFPEGTRNGIAKGEKYHNGVAFLAVNEKVPVIPVGIDGKIKPFSRLTVRFGKPIEFSEYYDVDNVKEKYEEINKKLQLNIQMQLTND